MPLIDGGVFMSIACILTELHRYIFGVFLVLRSQGNEMYTSNIRYTPLFPYIVAGYIRFRIHQETLYLCPKLHEKPLDIDRDIRCCLSATKSLVSTVITVKKVEYLDTLK